MTKLTEAEIIKYEKPANAKTGVKGITREMLEKINKDSLETLEYEKSDFLVNKDKTIRYKYDSFTPRAGSIYFKPAFAGNQFPLGIVKDTIIFPNGKWFAC